MQTGLKYELCGAQFEIAPDGTLTAFVSDPNHIPRFDIEEGVTRPDLHQIVIAPRDVLGMALMFRLPTVWRFLQQADRTWQGQAIDRQIKEQDILLNEYERLDREQNGIAASDTPDWEHVAAVSFYNRMRVELEQARRELVDLRAQTRNGTASLNGNVLKG